MKQTRLTIPSCLLDTRCSATSRAPSATAARENTTTTSDTTVSFSSNAHKCRVASARPSVSPLVIKQQHEIKWINKDGYRFRRGFNAHYKLQTVFALPLNAASVSAQELSCLGLTTLPVSLSRVPTWGSEGGGGRHGTKDKSPATWR